MRPWRVGLVGLVGLVRFVSRENDLEIVSTRDGEETH